jgi:transposase InsO family protein
LGLNRISALEPNAPVRRYERERPGELIHRFARAGHRVTGNRQGCRNEGAGWEFVHVAIDDHSRIAFAKVMASEKKRSATAFLNAALAYYESLGIKIERVMTDNGSCYKSFAFRRACKRFGLRHIRTRPYTPKTNGKAERFIQTSLREWAYAQAYQTSRQRKAELAPWLHRYKRASQHPSVYVIEENRFC